MGTYSSKQLDLSRKLSPKWGEGRYSVVGPLSQGYGIFEISEFGDIELFKLSTILSFQIHSYKKKLRALYVSHAR